MHFVITLKNKNKAIKVIVIDEKHRINIQQLCHTDLIKAKIKIDIFKLA